MTMHDQFDLNDLKIHGFFAVLLVGFIGIANTGTTVETAKVTVETAKVTVQDLGDRLSAALKFTMPWEGGLADHPSDPGGRTNKGVTQATYDAWRSGRSLPTQAVDQIQAEEVKKIYEQNYWKAGGCDQYKAPLDVACFDSVVNFGVGGGKSFFKDLPSDPTAAATQVAEQRQQYRHQRVSEKPSQEVFLQGWLNRDNALKELVDESKR